MDIIKNIDGNVAVCAIVGQYRCGKSYILNLMLDKKQGFELGDTFESCTKGIWMWSTPIKHKNEHGEFYYILLDTEGLGSPNSKAEHDNKIFILSLLLSSLFIYNTKNVIDRNAIKQLAIMSNLSKFINNSIQQDELENGNKEETMNLNSPDFIWTVRDFFLGLKM